jgi:hypothetical protein
MRPDQPVRLQREVRDSAWRTIARLRAGRNAVLNALIPLRGTMNLRVASGALVSASAAVPRNQSRL